MELSEKIQELRRKKGITQEELADALFVSRTAISKWESGRGYPNIDSLKAIAKFFSVSIDDLLSGEELLGLAEENQKQKTLAFHDLIFGFLDILAAMLLFLPFFGERRGGDVFQVPLLSINEIQLYLKISFFAIVIIMVVFGITTLALQNFKGKIWLKGKTIASLALSAAALLLFILSLQAYAAVFVLVLLALKAIILIKTR